MPLRFSIFLFITMQIAPAVKADVITLRADSWCPYTCDPAEGRLGFMVEIAKLALEPAGHSVDYKILNWARAIAETRKGKFSGIIGAVKADAPDFIYPNIAAGSQNMCFFTSGDNKWTFQSALSLNDIIFGAITDYTYSPEVDDYIKKNGKKVQLIGSDNPLKQNIMKLQAKRIGAFIDDKNATAWFIKGSDSTHKNIKIAGCTPPSELFIAFSPGGQKSGEYAKLIQEKTAAMRADGSLKRLLSSYSVEDWQSK